MGTLVTGGAGYIGSHMVLDLLDSGEEVVVLDNLATGFLWAVDKRATLYVGDVGNQELAEEIIGKHNIDSVFHFAGSVVVPESVADPLKYYGNNTCATRQLVKACISCHVPYFIFSSTAAVYGMPKKSPVDETTQLQPISPYGTSKLMSEWMLRDTAVAHGLSFVVLRYFNVAGADDQLRTGQSTPEATHLIKAACQTALRKRKKMEIFGHDYDTPDGTGVRDYIHVSDLIEAHMLALKYLRRGGDNVTLNCGYGRGFSVREVIETVKSVSARNFKAIERPRRPGDPAILVAQADKIRELLHWQPHHDDLEKIVRDALNWEHHLEKIAR